jgi:hypothetical protein
MARNFFDMVVDIPVGGPLYWACHEPNDATPPAPRLYPRPAWVVCTRIQTGDVVR